MSKVKRQSSKAPNTASNTSTTNRSGAASVPAGKADAVTPLSQPPPPPAGQQVFGSLPPKAAAAATPGTAHTPNHSSGSHASLSSSLSSARTTNEGSVADGSCTGQITRKERNRMRAIKRRERETSPERTKRREMERLRAAARRQNESPAEREVRRRNGRLRAMRRRENETEDERLKRREQNRMRMAERRRLQKEKKLTEQREPQGIQHGGDVNQDSGGGCAATQKAAGGHKRAAERGTQQPQNGGTQGLAASISVWSNGDGIADPDPQKSARSAKAPAQSQSGHRAKKRAVGASSSKQAGASHAGFARGLAGTAPKPVNRSTLVQAASTSPRPATGKSKSKGKGSAKGKDAAGEQGNSASGSGIARESTRIHDSGRSGGPNSMRHKLADPTNASDCGGISDAKAARGRRTAASSTGCDSLPAPPHHRNRDDSTAAGATHQPLLQSQLGPDAIDMRFQTASVPPRNVVEHAARKQQQSEEASRSAAINTMLAGTSTIASQMQPQAHSIAISMATASPQYSIGHQTQPHQQPHHPQLLTISPTSSQPPTFAPSAANGSGTRSIGPLDGRFMNIGSLLSDANITPQELSSNTMRDLRKNQIQLPPPVSQELMGGASSAPSKSFLGGPDKAHPIGLSAGIAISSSSSMGVSLSSVAASSQPPNNPNAFYRQQPLPHNQDILPYSRRQHSGQFRQASELQDQHPRQQLTQPMLPQLAAIHSHQQQHQQQSQSQFGMIHQHAGTSQAMAASAVSMPQLPMSEMGMMFNANLQAAAAAVVAANIPPSPLAHVNGVSGVSSAVITSLATPCTSSAASTAPFAPAALVVGPLAPFPQAGRPMPGSALHPPYSGSMNSSGLTLADQAALGIGVDPRGTAMPSLQPPTYIQPVPVPMMSHQPLPNLATMTPIPMQRQVLSQEPNLPTPRNPDTAQSSAGSLQQRLFQSNRVNHYLPR
ncbi:hypothetical protein GQ54DRAFT_139176 [Martensiomyces pterosporus]|nr:hypothetical protein GQ54DRAFT_139176 [Martensiomyces pterosporus]